MTRFCFPRACLTAGALLCLAVAAPAADLDKYLPDDAQMVAVVNVKQITSWTPFQKQFQDQVQQAVKSEPAQLFLKDTGFDPLRDVERLVIVCAASSPQVLKPPTAYSTSPFGYMTFLLVHGKFDADKLEAKAEQAAKDHPAMVKSRMVGATKLWEIAPGPGDDHYYLAMLDKDTLMATGLESQALEALDKANGKRKTDLTDKRVRDAVARTDPKAALQAAASGDLATKAWMKADDKEGYATESLHEKGFEGFRLTVNLGDADLHYEFALTVKDAEKSQALAKNMTEVVDKAIAETKAHPERTPKDLLPVMDALKTVKITASGDSVAVEGNATADAVQWGVQWMLHAREDAVVAAIKVTQGGKSFPATAGSLFVELTPVDEPNRSWGAELTSKDGSIKFYVPRGKYKVIVELMDASMKDQLGGKFNSQNTKILRDVDGKTPLDIDVTKPEG